MLLSFAVDQGQLGVLLVGLVMLLYSAYTVWQVVQKKRASAQGQG